MKNEQLAEMLTRFANGEAELWEFDDFLSSSQSGKLEQVRLELSLLPEQYPAGSTSKYCNAEGLDRLRQIAKAVRSLSGASAT